MKKYILGILILSIIAGGVIASRFYTSYAVKKITASADKAVEAVTNQDFEKAKAEADTMYDDYMRCNGILSAYTSHIKLDEIHASISRVMAYIDNESDNDSLSELYNIKARLEIILAEEKLSIGNIL